MHVLVGDGEVMVALSMANKVQGGSHVYQGCTAVLEAALVVVVVVMLVVMNFLACDAEDNRILREDRYEDKSGRLAKNRGIRVRKN